MNISKEKHPDRYMTANEEVKRNAEKEYSQVNEAYQNLMDDDRRLQNLLRQLGVIEGNENYNLDPDFLMEMMDLNEQMTENREAAIENIYRLEQEADKAVESILCLDNWENLTEDEKQALKNYYFQKKYLQRAKKS